MRSVVLTIGGVAVRTILTHLGDPTSSPRLVHAGAPLLWERFETPMGRNDPQPQTLPEQDLDWRISWELQYEMKVSKRKKRSESTRRGPSWQNRPQAPSKMQFPWPFGAPRIRDRE